MVSNYLGEHALGSTTSGCSESPKPGGEGAEVVSGEDVLRGEKIADHAADRRSGSR
jgi:hypothetical protein